MRSTRFVICTLGLLSLVAVTVPASAQEARRRWEQQCQIRKDKFDYVLPQAMRENGIDMWLVMMKEGHYDPLYDDLGRGYPGRVAYYVFTDRGGDRIERAALGLEGATLEACGAYDIVSGDDDIRKFVAVRDPKKIGVNMSEEMGGADGLSHTAYLELTRTLAEPWASRIVSAQKLVSDFRSRRVASEVAAFAEAGHFSRAIAERALSNEVIRPGATTLEDVAWWMQDRLLERGLGSSFDMPSVYITGPDGIEATSNRRVIQRGDLVVIDWGVCVMNFCTDMKRLAYVLKEGERQPPNGVQHAFDQAVRIREVVHRTIKPGRRADETLKALNQAVAAAGFSPLKTFNKPTDSPATEFFIGCHSVGNQGHDIGPSVAFFNPLRLTFEIRPMTMLSIEFFAWTPAPEWSGKKVRIPLEDDAIVTERGVEWMYPINNRILLIG
jgi:Xaa-Pro aminopeptidase